MTTAELLPRAKLRDVARGRAPLVGSRIAPGARRGWVSPVEARVLMGIPYGDLAEEERRYVEGADRTPGRDAGVLARALFARLLAPRGGARPVDRPWIVSASVDNLEIEQALDAVLLKPTGGRARTVCFVHPHSLNLAAFDAELAERLAEANVVLPDGVGVRIAASLLGVAMRHNLNGTDLLPLLCTAAAAEGVPLALVGAAEGVAERCADNLRGDHPGLRVALVSHGYVDGEASRRIARELEAVGRCIVLVGMGSPLQERWAHEHLRPLPEATVVTVGGLFDFFSGDVARAPVIWRELGLEWLWRLRQEPRRLAKRYLLGNPLFLSLALSQRLGLLPRTRRRRLSEARSRPRPRSGPGARRAPPERPRR